MRPLAVLAGAALLLAACAGSQESEPLTISEVSVNTDLTAVGSRRRSPTGRA